MGRRGKEEEEEEGGNREDSTNVFFSALSFFSHFFPGMAWHVTVVSCL